MENARFEGEVWFPSGSGLTLAFIIMNEAKSQFESDRLVLVHEFQKLYCCIISSEILKNTAHKRAWSLSPNFMSITQFSFFATIVMWANKLMAEQDEDAKSLPKLIKFIQSNRKRLFEANTHITNDVITADIADLEGLETKRLRTLRNKYFAHFDKAYANKKEALYEDNIITFLELKDMVSKAEKILDKYSSAYDGTRISLKPIDADDSTKLLDYINAK